MTAIIEGIKVLVNMVVETTKNIFQTFTLIRESMTLPIYLSSIFVGTIGTAITMILILYIAKVIKDVI